MDHDDIDLAAGETVLTDAEKMATELGVWFDKWAVQVGADDVIKALRDEADRMSKAVANYEDYGAVDH